jgi:hypothetical protein
MRLHRSDRMLAHLDLPIESAEGLMEVDPGLSLDCLSVLRGGPAVMRELNPSGGDGYLRRIMLRTAGDGQAEELIVSCEPSMSAQRLELTQIRKHLADALGAAQNPFVSMA